MTHSHKSSLIYSPYVKLKAIKPMTLSDVKLRQKDKVEHMAQLLQ